MGALFTGNGIAHSILLFAVVIALGLYLAKFKVKGVSIGSTWILFVGIILSHFGLRSNPIVLSFMKDFGLILFVFSIGLQVGPGFFSAFKKDGVKLNLLSTALVLLAVIVTVAIHFITKESIFTMTGVMSGAVTNTPGLGAAQQTLSDSGVAGVSPTTLASAYAVAYPIGVLGVIFLLILSKSLFKIDLDHEREALDKEQDTGDTARRMHCQVSNPAIYGKTLKEIVADMGDRFVVSRILHDGKITTPGPQTVFHEGDKLLIVTDHKDVDTVRIIFGEEVPLHQEDWNRMDSHMVPRKLTITNTSLTGKHLYQLGFRKKYNVTVTRVIRSGIELVARPGLILQMGDSIIVVGTEEDIEAASKVVGNKPERLSHPNLVPIFFGIALGVIFGSLPIAIPGIPQPVKLGLAGGPLIIAILLGYFGPRLKITTYTTTSANMMLREIGISFFMAAVGLDAGKTFVSSITAGGYWWILYGALITLIPIATIILLSRLVFKLNFYEICGLVSGGTTDPAVLSFAQNLYGTDYASINYATVYPLTMFLRVLVAQLMILLAL
ncbi:MAG: putative transporter [Bacteroidales bacterium]|nr:putative transporter [Bacteroidales bacterium]MBQ3846818.1 putative transporter [Bacteroidales bacterium]